MAASPIRASVLEFLADRRLKHGESVEFGWFIFQTVVAGRRVDLETLDFKAMASFTRDFSAVDRIHREQQDVLRLEGVEPEWCTLRHAAYVGKSYTPGHKHAFMDRMDPLDDTDRAGWYVGISNDPLDVNDPDNLYLESLYELSIHDPRLVPYWLLPVGYVVTFDGSQAKLRRR